MDVNAENERIISSDEYSDECDYDDAVMIDSIRAQDQNVRSDDHCSQNRKMDQKRKQISSLIRRNKLFVLYKRKSIKWLNNKRQRERYRNRLSTNANNVNMVQVECPALPSMKNQYMNENITTNDQDTQKLNVEKNETNFNSKSDKEKVKEINKIYQNNPFLFDTNINPKKDDGEKSTIHEEGENMQNVGKSRGANKQTSLFPWRRSRSKSPAFNQSNDRNPIWSGNKFRSDFPNFDRTAGNHISHTESSYSKNMDEKMKTLSVEIDKLNAILHAKEKELNRLCRLKMVKEEMFFRLDRKRKSLMLREGFSEKLNQYSPFELKELEICLADKKDTSEVSCFSKSVHDLIENRAKMNSADLKLEKNNMNRLHSILVSQNVLHPQFSGNSSLGRSGKKNDVELIKKNSENTNYTDGEKWTSSLGRLDFKEKQPNLFPRVVKRTKLSDLNAKQTFSLSLLENKTRSQLLKKDKKSQFLSVPNSINEISITPVDRSKKLSHCLGNIHLIGRDIKKKFNGILNEKYSSDKQFPLCQECKVMESRFVCAGCGKQWYCSKSCQIAAWDIHSEICTE